MKQAIQMQEELLQENCCGDYYDSYESFEF